jgi:hypothetical protein
MLNLDCLKITSALFGDKTLEERERESEKELRFSTQNFQIPFFAAAIKALPSQH